MDTIYIIILVVFWLSSGAVSQWRFYQGLKKESYERWNLDVKLGYPNTVKLIKITTIVIIIGGLVSAILIHSWSSTTWYYKTPKK